MIRTWVYGQSLVGLYLSLYASIGLVYDPLSRYPQKYNQFMHISYPSAVGVFSAPLTEYFLQSITAFYEVNDKHSGEPYHLGICIGGQGHLRKNRLRTILENCFPIQIIFVNSYFFSKLTWNMREIYVSIQHI